jgi:hypothetical protein
MADAKPPPLGGEPPEEIPFGQRFLDSPFVLLVICIVVMFVFYTGWGLVELAMLSEAPLP